MPLANLCKCRMADRPGVSELTALLSAREQTARRCEEVRSFRRYRAVGR